ncbi:LCP family protein [candidate division WWE3 bacterium]|uniref:LCP family protein n=1 Tax=candidate division WWE3 bacterium TaxID=2053526 RepID=A0A955RP23_UNCKA|nr:LCP family protein [candidate division WWE3 bacterium]
MKYTNNNINRRAKKNRVRSSAGSSTKRRSVFKSIGIVITFVFVLYGMKLLLTPVVKTLANVWEESTTAISFMLPGGPKIAKDEYGHTNVLMVGIDRRSYQPYEYDGPDGTVSRNGFLADTIIIASIDPETQNVEMISLPRDLWVKVPGFEGLAEQHTKINAVHALGDRFDYSDGGGMGLLKGVVEEIVGIPIHYWTRIDFDAFVKGVDAVDGVDIFVEQPFTDYMYPRSGYEDAAWEERYEIVSFEEGWQHLDGETALKYARSRHALGPEGSDFARAKRQQNVIEATANKILSSETLLNIDRLQGLYTAVSDNIATNISLGDIPVFYQIAKNVKQANIEGHVLGGPENDPPLIYNPDPGLFGGAYVLIPTAGQNNYSEIQTWAHDIYYASDFSAPSDETQ